MIVARRSDGSGTRPTSPLSLEPVHKRFRCGIPTGAALDSAQPEGGGPASAEERVAWGDSRPGRAGLGGEAPVRLGDRVERMEAARQDAVEPGRPREDVG